MKYLGIDQSYSGFGYSFQEGIRHETAKKAFPMSKFDNQGHRLHQIEMWLLTEILPDAEYVAMEGYANAMKFGREVAGELGGVVKKACWYLDLPLIVVPPTTLKKFVTGKGTAKKSEMLLGVYKTWGAEFRDDNMADAFGLAKFLRVYLGEDPGKLTKMQIGAVEAFKKAHTEDT